MCVYVLVYEDSCLGSRLTFAFTFTVAKKDFSLCCVVLCAFFSSFLPPMVGLAGLFAMA